MANRTVTNNPNSAFAKQGMAKTIEQAGNQVRELYLSDEIPWVIGYSGGKDSTATLQLVWNAIAVLPPSQKKKPIHVISTDTLVENPIVALWVTHSLKAISEAADAQNMPIQAHRLTPSSTDSYWVNLLGKGYPAPRPKFRWCTSRLKINPSNSFIQNLVRQNGEAILVLGTRKAESTSRHANIEKWENQSTRDLLSAHGQLDRSWVYTPVSTWSNDDVWLYLNQVSNPWGFTNKNLLGMYQGATQDGECPLVVDSNTPSCGDSRFGCFVCTLVEKDKSMQAMIYNDQEKEWMLPLMEFRNKWLDVKEDRQHRDFRKMNGSLMVHRDQLVHGPYRASYRHQMLEAILQAEVAVRELGPEEVKDFQLIQPDELEEIRRIWVEEKGEFEDSLPSIYERATGRQYTGRTYTKVPGISATDLTILKEICENNGDEEGILFQLCTELIHIEHGYRTMARRAGLTKRLDKALDKAAFLTEGEAEEYALERKRRIDELTTQSPTDLACIQDD